MKNADNIKKFLNKYKKQLILITTIIILIIAVTIIMLKRNQIKNNAETQIAKEVENNKIEFNIEIKGETENDYNCLLTFTSNDENDKIKSIEYPVKDGETNSHVLNVTGEDGRDKIAVDYKFNKGDENKTFKVTTTRRRYN